MDALPDLLTHAALDARERLTGLSRRAAVASAAPGSPVAAGTMAAAAREAIFADALLAALHARLEALKTVTK